MNPKLRLRSHALRLLAPILLVACSRTGFPRFPADAELDANTGTGDTGPRDVDRSDTAGADGGMDLVSPDGRDDVQPPDDTRSDSDEPIVRREVCDNGRDDDRDGRIDCGDSDCTNSIACLPDECPDGTPTCERNRDCGRGWYCDNGCCAPSVVTESCQEEGAPCSSLDESSDWLVCDTSRRQCLPRCDSNQANESDSGGCERGSWCVQIPAADSGGCVRSECTDFFARGECADGGNCMPFTNGASLCAPRGAAGEGAPCQQWYPGQPDLDPNALCQTGLVCFNGLCTTPCDRDTGECASGEACVEALGNAGTNRPGICGSECEPFSTGECPAGQRCTPGVDATGVHDWVCIDTPVPGDAAVGDRCFPGAIECVEGAMCLNEDDYLTDGSSGWICHGLCDPIHPTHCNDSEACFPSLGAELGVCTYACDPYPRRGSGHYDECPGGRTSCQPFVPDATEWRDAQGVCWDRGGTRDPYESCDAQWDWSQCDDLALCVDLSFREAGARCWPLCEPFSEGSCDEGVCSPLLSLFGLIQLGTCDPEPEPGWIGDACDDSRIGTCEAPNSLCLDVGSGGACTQICRAGHPADCLEGSCRTGVFEDPIPAYMGVCL